MTLERLLQAVHGHAGILAAAALLHPAILLRAGKPLGRRNVWSVLLATALATGAWASGAWIYADYRAQVKRPLFLTNERAGLLFETKEHVAVLVVAFALGACVTALVAPRGATSLRRSAALAYATAAVACVVVSALGTWVTAVRGF